MRATLWTNLSRALSDPGMALGYAQWRLSSVGGVVSTPFGGRLNGFVNFTEYWSFRTQGTPALIEQRLAKRQLQPGAIAIDVGANIGMWSVMLAKANTGTRVFSFEPNPAVYQRLVANLRANQCQNVVALNQAASESVGELVFYCDPIAPDMSRAIAPSEDVRSIPPENLRRVPTATLDGVCAEQNIERIALLKIDVEGHELSVLKGARRLFSEQRVEALVIEICPANLAHAGVRPVELWDYLQSVGYQFHQLNEDGSRGAALTREEFGRIGFDDAFAFAKRADAI